MSVVELGERHGLLAEVPASGLVTERARRQYFHGDVSVEQLIVSAVDHTHSAGSDLFEDAIMA